MRERDVEKYLGDKVKALDGEVRKVKWINRNGAPDRLVMLWGGHFVEVKKPGEKLEPHQVREHNRMKKHGLSVHVVDSYESVDAFIRVLMRKAGYDV